MVALKTFEAITFLLGVLSTVMAGRWCLHFMTSRHGIGRSIALLTLGDTVCSAVVSVFAGLTLIGWLPDAPDWFLATGRALMFCVVILAMTHLSVEVRKIEQTADDDASLKALADAEEARDADRD